MPTLSTVTNLSLYSRIVSEALDKNKQVDTIFTDFKKAFDAVPHSILIAKLYSLGFRDPILSWLLRYLSFCTQIVRIAGFD